MINIFSPCTILIYKMKDLKKILKEKILYFSDCKSMLAAKKKSYYKNGA
jgi:hypothetical protein